jgi:DNA replication protein DnaC
LPPLGSVNSGFQLSMLFRIIDRRYRDLKATVMTLNVATRAEAETRLSPNIVDRLAHGAMAIHCNWPSYRRN